MFRITPVFLIAVLAWLPPPCDAQNISNYGAIPEPLLFLLREPAVWKDLGLSEVQTRQLKELNEQFDGELLAARNMSADKNSAIVDRVMATTRTGISKLFTYEQQDRLRQITYRLRGISFVLMPHASNRLGLSPKQTDKIEAIAKRKADKVAQILKDLNSEEVTQAEAKRHATVASREESQRILFWLSSEQKRELSALVGRKFDITQLGQVSFQAPEFSATGMWINTPKLQLAQLKGKVIALHFWRFG